MRFQHVIEQVYHRPWSITPAGFSAVSKVISAHLTRAEGISMADFVNPRREMCIANGVATIDICGVLGSGLSQMEKSCGNTDYCDVEDEIEDALVAGAQSIDFTIDSPGGMCSGNIECGRAIAAITVPTRALISGQGCSAAYLLAAGCDKIIARPSAIVGSIGCIMARVDESAAWEMEGIKPDFITNTGGDLKSTGHGPSINDAQREFLQQTVDDMFESFREHVLTYREVSPDAMRGQFFVGPRALAMNLVDALG